MSGIRGKTRLFCVLGHPVAHSLSPAMQNAALQAMGIDGVYVAFDVAPDGLGDAVRGLQALGVAGVNCTVPHKEAVVPFLDELSDEARFIGAVNTIVLRDGRRAGHNTDAPGFLAALRAEGVEPAGREAVVLGAGGSARAVLVALARCGTKIALANRTAARAAELAEELNERLGDDAIRPVSMDSRELEKAVERAEILVNTTSVGMSPDVEAMPPIPADALHPNLFVYDLIYNPLETRLLREARRRGSRGAHGAGMLAQQGALALELWTGQPAPVKLMEQVVVEALDGCGIQWRR